MGLTETEKLNQAMLSMPFTSAGNQSLRLLRYLYSE